MPSDTASGLRHADADDDLYRTSERVLLLAPSRGLGGGIERYIDTLEWAFADQRIPSQRIDLDRPGLRAHMKLLASGRTLLRVSAKRTRLVVGHRALMPVASLLARNPMVSGISILCYGCDVWNERHRPRTSIERALMRRSNVRAVAISGFTAGTLALDCQSTILPSRPIAGVVRNALSCLHRSPASHARNAASHGFPPRRLAEQGLPQLIEAITVQRRKDIRLTICGSGEPPPDLLRLVDSHDWCNLRVGLTDGELAAELASADLFVLATRTRTGRHANGEGFGLVLLEAQVAGTPVIAPAYGGSSDAYADGATGIAPVDESAEALASAIKEMLENPVRLGANEKARRSVGT